MSISKKCYFAIIFANSVLLAIGISLVGISIAQYGNKWPILTIIVHLLAILFPTACNRCNSIDDGEYHIFGDTGNDWTNGITHISWVLFGLLVVVGYAVPVELFRAGQLKDVAVYLTVSGGTTILAAVLIYVKVIYFQESDE
jgi:O-antigen/teichoic acid export membrane protein